MSCLLTITKCQSDTINKQAIKQTVKQNHNNNGVDRRRKDMKSVHCLLLSFLVPLIFESFKVGVESTPFVCDTESLSITIFGFSFIMKEDAK
jgi:hypothetical protein